MSNIETASQLTPRSSVSLSINDYKLTSVMIDKIIENCGKTPNCKYDAKSTAVRVDVVDVDEDADLSTLDVNGSEVDCAISKFAVTFNVLISSDLISSDSDDQIRQLNIEIGGVQLVVESAYGMLNVNGCVESQLIGHNSYFERSASTYSLYVNFDGDRDIELPKEFVFELLSEVSTVTVSPE